MWPFGDGQIQTSVHAGGMAKRFIRSSRCSSRIVFPSVSEILEVFAFRFAAVTRPIVIDILQTGFLRSLCRISRDSRVRLLSRSECLSHAPPLKKQSIRANTSCKCLADRRYPFGFNPLNLLFRPAL